MSKPKPVFVWTPWNPYYPLHVERGSIDDEPDGVDLDTHVTTWAIVDDDGNWVADGIPSRAWAEHLATLVNRYPFPDALAKAKGGAP